MVMPPGAVEWYSFEERTRPLCGMSVGVVELWREVSKKYAVSAKDAIAWRVRTDQEKINTSD